MRELMKIFGQHYSAVNTSDINFTENGNQQHQADSHEKFRKSLQTKRTFTRGFSFLDSFFFKRQSDSGPRWPKGVFLLMSGGLLAIFSAIIMYIVQPYDAIFKWKLIFGDDGEIFNLWQNPPVDLYVKIYLFNITNAEEFMRGDEKMKVEEVGPYVYREMLLHDEIVFNTNGTISMVPKHPLVWNEELSMGNREDDVFMLPNIALLGENHSNNYTKFRPKTPQKCIDWILEYLSENLTSDDGTFSSAADIGCGTGQCTLLLANYFKNVYGFDVSESQIKQANTDNEHSNICYMVSSAEQIPLPDHSLDLITCSQCFHWFDFEKFYTEVRRLLKPGGVLALITYVRPLIVHGDEEIRDLIRNVFVSPPLNEYVDEKLKIVDNGYADVVLPFNDVRRKLLTIYTANVSGSQVIGYIKSWSSYGQCLQSDEKLAEQVVSNIEAKIKDKTGNDVNEEQFTLETPFYLLLARK